MADDALPELADDNAISTSGSENLFQQVMNDPQKRLYAMIAAGVLVLGLILFITLGPKEDENRGKLVSLVQDLSQARAFEVVARLKSVNIEAKVAPAEKPGEFIVSVYENAVETAYLNLSRTNLLEEEGYGLFDQNDWAASDYDKRIKLTRAINGDLSRIISRMENIRSAIVRVNIPEQPLFTEFATPTTATVQLELEDSANELDKSQISSIVNVLRGYVPNMEKEHISIVDTLGNNYNSFKTEDETTVDDFIDQIEKINKQITDRIEKYLNDIIGSEKYKVSVSASVSREKVQKQQTIYSEGAVGKRQVGAENLNAGASGFGPGAGGGKNYTHDTSAETLLPSFEQQSTTFLPGRITKVSVALAVDTSIAATMSLKQLQESVAAIVGPTTLAEHVKLTVIDLGKQKETLPLVQQTKQANVFLNFFQGNGFFGTAMKIFAFIGTLLGILLIGIVGLNFLNIASKQGTEKIVEQGLGDEFDDVMNSTEDSDEIEDYGEQRALEQQEALLREMMNPSAEPVAAAKAGTAHSYSAGGASNAEFESLLNNFQSVANSKPDLLARKIQVWLEQDAN